MAPVIEDTFQAVINWTTGGGQTAKNVLYFATTAAGDAPDLATALGAAADDAMFNAVASAASALTVSIKPMDGVAAPAPYDLANWAGTAGGDYEPALSHVITLYTAEGGKSQRGRLFLPFVAEAACTNGLLIGDARDGSTAAWNAFLAAMAAADWAWVVASLIEVHTRSETDPETGAKTTGIPNGAAVPHTTPIIRCQSQTVLGTQRRRQSRLR